MSKRTGKPTRKIERGRWTSARKVEVVLRLLKGEDLDAVSRQLGLKPSSIASWRDEFMASGQAGLKDRAPDPRDGRIRELHAKVGEQAMEIELLEDKIGRLEKNLPPAPRRPMR